MEPRIFKYILQFSLKQQIAVVALTLLSFPILYVSLELPKIIINDALGAAGEPIDLLGYELGAEQFLLALCGGYLLIILLSGLLKMRINTMKGVIGERLVRRLRYHLTDRILRFPPKHFQRVSQGELISTVTAETEPLAGFIGDSIALPLFQGGTMFTILLFMFMQDPILGFASIMLIPLQLVLIPRLQKRINQLKKERVKTVRHFSERIGEAVDGAIDIRIHGTERYHQAEFSSILGRLFAIRLEIFNRKFFMKFLNNFINSLTPILFYSIGGILAIRGDITVGALVAAIAAHKELTAPWRELLNFYQIYQDAKIKYEQILDRFRSDALSPETHDEPEIIDPDQRVKGDLILDDIWLLNDAGERFLHIPQAIFHEHNLVSVYAENSSYSRSLSYALTRLQAQANGEIRIGDQNLEQIPDALRRRRIAYAGPDAFLFNENVAQNVHYGMRLRPPENDDSEDRSTELVEAQASGNSVNQFRGVWTDFSILGFDTWLDMRPWFEACIYAVGAGPVVYRFGLQEKFDPNTAPEDFAERFLTVRRRIHDELLCVGDNDQIHRFREHHFNRALTMLENISFALSSTPTETARSLANNELMRSFLRQTELETVALQAGAKLAQDIYRELMAIEPDHPLPVRFARFDEIRIRECLLAHFDSGLEMTCSQCDDPLLIELFLRSCSGSSIKPLITDEVQEKVVAAREIIRRPQWQELMQDQTPLHHDFINPHLTVLENVLFGKLEDPTSDDHESLQQHIEQIMIEEQARSLVLILLSMSKVGIRGSRLPTPARQRIQLLRGLIKRPDVLIMHESLSALEDRDQVNILRNIKQLIPGITIVSLDRRQPDPNMFDQYFTIKDGRMLELKQLAEEKAS